jgi:CheY-like chemotaxis protein
MECPRCRTVITQPFDPDSIILCSVCGSRLMTRAAALRSQGGKTKLPDESHPPGSASPPPGAPAGGGQVSLDRVLHEVMMLKVTQAQILEALRRGAAGPEAAKALNDPGPDATQVLAPVRSRRRKTVLVVDDDPETQKQAVEQLQQADVPVRAVKSGKAALAAIAEEKPDVVAIEIGLSGDMAGKDLINMIKATMEWVDIPIVLWTREEVDSQKEARLKHGADEVVLKSSGADALVTRVITLFRRA